MEFRKVRKDIKAEEVSAVPDKWMEEEFMNAIRSKWKELIKLGWIGILGDEK